jgi:UPF0716 protein FxsA
LGLVILLAMIVVPITEIAVFIEAGDLIGLWPTIGAVILTAIIGSTLLRLQGLSTLVRVQESMNAGRLPVAELFDGLCLLIAGAFLLTPGFVTDGVGLLLFLPPFRAVLRGLLANRIKARSDFQMHMNSAPGAGPRQGNSFDSTIIDGEFHEVPPENDNNAATPKGADKDHPLPPPGN